MAADRIRMYGPLRAMLLCINSIDDDVYSQRSAIFLIHYIKDSYSPKFTPYVTHYKFKTNLTIQLKCSEKWFCTKKMVPSLDLHVDNRQVICVHSETSTWSSRLYGVFWEWDDGGRAEGGRELVREHLRFVWSVTIYDAHLFALSILYVGRCLLRCAREGHFTTVYYRSSCWFHVVLSHRTGYARS